MSEIKKSMIIWGIVSAILTIILFKKNYDYNQITILLLGTNFFVKSIAFVVCVILGTITGYISNLIREFVFSTGIIRQPDNFLLAMLYDIGLRVFGVCMGIGIGMLIILKPFHNKDKAEFLAGCLSYSYDLMQPYCECAYDGLEDKYTSGGLRKISSQLAHIRNNSSNIPNELLSIALGCAKENLNMTDQEIALIENAVKKPSQTISPSPETSQPDQTQLQSQVTTTEVPAQVEKEPLPVNKAALASATEEIYKNRNGEKVEEQTATSSSTTELPTPLVAKVEQPAPDNSQIQQEREELAKYKAKDVFNDANKQIDIIWNATTQKIRDAILPEQDEWLKKRENDCGLKASSEEPNNSVLQETIKFSCMAAMTDQRTAVLKQTIASLETSNNAKTSAKAEPISADNLVDAVPASAEQHIQKMLQGAMTNDEGSIQASRQYLDNLPKPKKGDKNAARKINEEGLKFIQTKQYDKAVPLFAKASQTDPSDVEILNNYGFSLMMSNNLSQAETVLIKTLIMKPDRTSAWSNLGYAFALQGKEDMATACYMNAYRFSKNPEKTLQFFKDQLAQEKNPNLRSAMIKAVEKAPAPSENTLQATASQKVPDNSQSQEETNIKAQNKLDAANSAYTSLEEKSCKILESHDDEGGGFISSCPGHAGYQIQIAGGDARSWLIILKNKRPVYDSQTDISKHATGNFATIDSKVLEWRYDNAKKLIGLIVRVGSQDKSDPSKEVSDLFVFRHDNGQFCYAGTHKTNEGAREIADSQTGCKP